MGRISLMESCWAAAGHRPNVKNHHIRERCYLFGAVKPHNGNTSFLITPNCNKEWMGEFLKALAEQYHDEPILLMLDNAVWHKAKALKVPSNIELFFIPPYTPEMNPIESLWKIIRRMGFKNRAFDSLKKVEDHLEKVIKELNPNKVKSQTEYEWVKPILMEN